MKKIVITSMVLAATVSALTGCGSKNSKITVISREDGSGTRSAFVELTGILKDDKDRTITSAEVSQSTSVVVSTVKGNENAIGYISLGSLDSSVKALKINGVEPTVDTVKDGSYTLSRGFNICTKDDVSEVANDFITFLLSAEGQSVIEEEGYISVVEGETYTASSLSGKISISGSTSVAPVMDVLSEEYMALNPDVTIEIQQSGSSAGITGTIEGACDIGMSSRELKDEEIQQGLTPTKIAMDGIAVIVNKDNEADDIATDDIQKIYTGEITDWNDING